MMEKQFLITESQLKALLTLSKKTDIHIEEMILDEENTLDIYVDGVPKYSFAQGDVFTE